MGSGWSGTGDLLGRADGVELREVAVPGRLVRAQLGGDRLVHAVVVGGVEAGDPHADRVGGRGGVLEQGHDAGAVPRQGADLTDVDGAVGVVPPQAQADVVAAVDADAHHDAVDLGDVLDLDTHARALAG